MPESKTSPRRLQAAERRRKAVELRKVGLSYDKIGKALGISRQAAYKAVQTQLDKIEQESAESVYEARRLELERLDEWQVQVEREMKNGKALPAIDRGLKIMDRRAKLLRLDPVRPKEEPEPPLIHPDDMQRVEEMTDEELMQAMNELLRTGSTTRF